MSQTLARLGLDARDRVVVIHADDVGMCHATVAAFEELSASGLVSSGAVMAPCPWLPAAVSLQKANPRLDIGIHLTLTSEWAPYRWRPLTGEAGLADAFGYLHPTAQAAIAGADPDAVLAEMREQVVCARAAGLHPTHLDAHMYVALEQPFFTRYLGLSEEFRIPAFVSRDGPQSWPSRQRTVEDWERRGFPVFDHRVSFRWRGDPSQYLEQAKDLFDAIQPGLTCLLIHPAIRMPELMAITPEWRYFVRDYEAFLDPRLNAYVRDSGITVIGYRALGETMPR